MADVSGMCDMVLALLCAV